MDDSKAREFEFETMIQISEKPAPSRRILSPIQQIQGETLSNVSEEELLEFNGAIEQYGSEPQNLKYIKTLFTNQKDRVLRNFTNEVL